VIWIALCVLVVVVGSIMVIFMWGRPRGEPGVARFQRHIDALSPEARQETQDRVRDQNDPKEGPEI
jgi:hypothetical protein